MPVYSNNGYQEKKHIHLLQKRVTAEDVQNSDTQGRHQTRGLAVSSIARDVVV